MGLYKEYYMSKAKEVIETLKEQLNDFDRALEDFITDSQRKIDHDEERYQYVQKTKLEKTDGPKYVRIVAVNQSHNGRSAWAFVNKENGDILKPASWKTPAKHARGNIYKKESWSSVGMYGPAYLK